MVTPSPRSGSFCSSQSSTVSVSVCLYFSLYISLYVSLFLLVSLSLSLVFYDILLGGSGGAWTNLGRIVKARPGTPTLIPQNCHDDDWIGAAAIGCSPFCVNQHYMVQTTRQNSAKKKPEQLTRTSSKKTGAGGNLGVNAEEGVRVEAKVRVREEKSQGETQTTTGLGFPST